MDVVAQLLKMIVVIEPCTYHFPNEEYILILNHLCEEVYFDLLIRFSISKCFLQFLTGAFA